MKLQDKIALIILDGWGLGPDDPEVNAIKKAKTSFVDSLSQYPNCKISTSAEDVGLPKGQMGNSEVGHLNIGAGRVVYQPLVLINQAFKDGSISQNLALKNAFHYAKENNVKVHLAGLVSDGGVHSSIEHLNALIKLTSEHHLPKVFIHAFTDGRDTDPQSGKGFIKKLQSFLSGSSAKIATICGRYYAMDRDNRWERIKLAYDLMVKGSGAMNSNAVDAIEKSYQNGNTDEFIKPIVLTDDKKQPIAKVEDGDVFICFNFRTDRGREITTALTQKAFPDYDMKPLKLHYLSMTEYDKTFKDVAVIFKNPLPVNTLGEIYAKAEKSQLRMAETEKYPHVTYFFSGGREVIFDKEDRIMIPSPKVATYDLKPEMSAFELTEAAIKAIEQKQHDLLIINYANPDMVAHTGDFKAVVKAVETTDQCAEKLVNFLQKKGYCCIITSDHGNADYMVNQDGSPNTAHTQNLVPLFLLTSDKTKLRLQDGRLCDIAPTILKLSGISKPKEMNGVSLITQS